MSFLFIFLLGHGIAMPGGVTRTPAPNTPSGLEKQMRLEIAYPSKSSEFELHSYTYENLKAIGLNVRGEVVDYTGNRNIGGWKCCFDLVVFDEDYKAIKIIEIKNSPNHSKNTRQYKRYSEYGIPLVYLCSYDQIDDWIYLNYGVNVGKNKKFEREGVGHPSHVDSAPLGMVGTQTERE